MDTIVLFKGNKILEMEGFKKLGESIYEAFEGYTFISREAFNNYILEKNFENIIGEFNYIRIDKSKNKVEILVDKLGRRSLYIFQKDKYIAISSDYWQLIEELKKNNIKFSMNYEYLIESIVYGTNFFNNTHVKEIKRVEYATYTRIDLLNHGIEKIKYWDFNLNSSINNIDEASDLLEEGINKTIESIDKSKVYGIGVSGGLDSRLLLYYAKKNDIRIFPFIISQKKPNKILYARDIIPAKRLCKLYNEELNIFDPFEYDFYDRLKYEIKHNPVAPANTDTVIINNLNVDAILTGANGYIVGGGVFSRKLLSVNREEYLNAFLTSFLPRSFNTLRRIFRVIIKSYRVKEMELIQKEVEGISYDLYLKVIRKIQEVVNNSKNCVEAQLKLYHVAFGQHNYYGVFESLSGRYPAYSIYTTYVADVINNFSPEHIIERKALKNLIMRIPEISKVGGQSPHSSLKLNVFEIMDYLIRGYGVRNREYDFRKYKHLYDEFSIIDIKKTKTILRSSRLFHDYVKHNIIFSYIKNGEWGDFVLN